MRIPNSTIIIRSQLNHCAVKQQPRWFAKMYKEVWGKRLDPTDGLSVGPVPDCTPESLRYSEYGSVSQAELATVQFFSGGNINAEGDIAAMFARNFPNGLGAEIEALLREDAQRLRVKEAKDNAPMVAHASFLAAEVSEVEALAFQRRGWATLAEVPAELLIVSEIVANAAKAMRVVESIEAAQKAPAKQSAAAGTPPSVASNPFPKPPAGAGVAR